MLKIDPNARYDIRIQRYLRQREVVYNEEIKKVLENIEDSADEAVNCTSRMANPYESRNGHR